MNFEITEQITPEIAEALLLEITLIQNLLMQNDDRQAFYTLGCLTEQLANVIRKG